MSFTQILLPAVFLGIIFAFGVSILFRDRLENPRRVGYVLLVIVLVANLTSVALLPVTVMHKYPQTTDSETAPVYEIYAVDADGNEIEIPGHVYDPTTGMLFAAEMLDADADTRRGYARLVLETAQRHRQDIMSRTIVDRAVGAVGPPSPILTDGWTKQELAKYDEFVGIRVYSGTVHMETPPRPRDERITNRTLEFSIMFNESASNPAVRTPAPPQLQPDTHSQPGVSQQVLAARSSR